MKYHKSFHQQEHLIINIYSTSFGVRYILQLISIIMIAVKLCFKFLIKCVINLSRLWYKNDMFSQEILKY